MNIVQRLGHRALTGRGLCVTVHEPYGYRFHFELRGEFGTRSFARWFRCNRSCDRFCIDVLRGYPEELCVCMLVREGFSPVPPGITRASMIRYALPGLSGIHRRSRD